MPHRMIRAAIALICLAAATAAQSAAGDWTGAVEVPGKPLQVQVHLEQRDGKWRGDIDIPAQHAEDMPLADIEVDGKSVKFAIAGVPGDPAFAGTLADDGSRIAGTFTQGGHELAFALRAAAEAKVADAAATADKFGGFAAWLDDSRTQLHAPGCAIAVVHGGAIAALFASGKRDIEGDLPVTADTLFAIGSSTKAFTTFVLATLVDEGKLQWDRPVRTWLPEFALADETVATQLTPRDLVTHRSGLPRHDLVWYGSKLARAEMVARLRWLPLSHGLREEWQYNNLMFLTAGYLAERVGGASWEELVRQRILLPLGMQRTNFSVAESARDGDHAEPYRRDNDRDRVDHIPFRDISAIGPAGSINSSAREMANWVALQLGSGKRGDARLLAAAAAKDLHRVRMPMGSNERKTAEIVDVGYALGWMVDVYRGHRRVHHGGNIDGFSAMVTLLPDDDWGIVALTNLDGTPLGELAVRNLIDRALGLEQRDWRSEIVQRVANAEAQAAKGKAAAALERRSDAPASRPLAEFAGTYADRGYGELSVRVDGDALAVDMHGIAARLEHWHFDVFRVAECKDSPDFAGMMVQFSCGFDGEVDAVRAVLDQNVEAIVFRRQPDARMHDPAFLDSLCGDYDVGGTTGTFARRGEELTFAIAGQFYVLTPRPGLVFDLQGASGYSVRFLLDGDGRPAGMRVRQPEGVFEGKRKAK